MSKRYKKDTARVLKESTRYIIPINNGITGNGEAEGITCVRLLFSAGDTHAFVKQQLRNALKGLGCNRANAQRYLKEAYPEIF